MTSPDPLIAYLAAHDAPCPGCYRNIRGHTEPECQACGQVLRLGEVLTMHAAFGDPKGDPFAIPAAQLREQLLVFLSESNINCSGCGYCLRGNTTGECPECGRQLALYELTALPSWNWKSGIATLINIGNFLPIMLSTALVATLSITSVGVDNSIAIRWFLALIGNLLLVWTFAGPVPRRLHRSLIWALLFNPICTTVFLIATISAIWRIVGYPSV